MAGPLRLTDQHGHRDILIVLSYAEVVPVRFLRSRSCALRWSWWLQGVAWRPALAWPEPDRKPQKKHHWSSVAQAAVSTNGCASGTFCIILPFHLKSIADGISQGVSGEVRPDILCATRVPQAGGTGMYIVPHSSIQELSLL